MISRILVEVVKWDDESFRCLVRSIKPGMGELVDSEDYNEIDAIRKASFGLDSRAKNIEDVLKGIGSELDELKISQSMVPVKGTPSMKQRWRW